MTALPSGPPHAERAWDRWQRVVDAVGAVEVAEGRAEMACPVHGGERRKFAISVGDESDYPLLRCRSECDDEDRETWLPKATAALLALGAPADALPPAKGQGGRQRPSTATPAAKARGRTTRAATPARLPTEDQLERWETAFLASDFMRRALMRKWRLTEDEIAAAEIGYDQQQDRIVLPVRDDAGELVQVLYRSLRDNLRPGEPKTKTHDGVRGSFIYAPFGVEDGRRVVLCAGERDAFVAHAAGFSAVCFTGGEGSVPTTDRLNLLSGRDVVVAYDNDATGQRGAVKAAAAVAAVAREVWVADLTTVRGLPPKGDVADVLAMDDGEQLLRDVLTSAMAWEGQPVEASVADGDYDRLLRLVRAEFLSDEDAAQHHDDDLLDDDGIKALPPVEWVVDGWVPRNGYTVVYGEPGVGKTLALLGMARAVRRGTRWQSMSTRQGAVLYYQGEGLAQFQDRIAAWDARYPLRSDQRMAPWAATERIVDLTTPEGVAAVLHTVRRFEQREGESVALVIVDPLVEYMTGEENGEGMERASRGLRALAKVGGLGVVVGHHSNASGERERGTAHLRMRAGSFMRMERYDEAGSAIGVMQHKQRNAARQALILEMREAAPSVVLEWTEAMDAQSYVAQKVGAASKKRREERGADAVERTDKAKALLLAAAVTQPGLSKTQLVGACMGQGVGKETLEATLALLVLHKKLRVEKGARDAQLHYPAEA